MDTNKRNMQIGKNAFIAAVLIILSLMILSGILTRVVPSGEYARMLKDGREVVVAGSFHPIDKPDYPIWRWFTAPIEVLWGDNALGLITIIVFLIFVGGAFEILDKGGIMKSVLALVVKRYQHRKYLLMGIIMFIFMFAAAVLGIFEAMVPLVIFIVPLAHFLGWDSLVGLGMSLLAVAFGFSAAITNPFSIGIAQQIAELPIFSGAWLRVIFFVVIFGLTYWFVARYARRVEKNPASSLVFEEDKAYKAHFAPELIEQDLELARTTPMRRALLWFSSIVALAVVFILVASRLPSISMLSFPVMGILLFAGGIGAGLFSGMGTRKVVRSFAGGAAQILPAVLLVMMAMSVQHIISQGGVMDTILYHASNAIARTPKFVAVFLLYGLTLVMDFFIGSASAKAFLMMPILAPLADLIGVTRQTTVMAFDFGDGFSNMLYPSNALLLVALGLTVVSYPKWIKWTIKLQLVVFVVSLAFLAFATAIHFGPF